MNPKPRRVRPLLLVLLWIWAGCIALVLDLFLNVAEFDGVRPRAPLYQAMRWAAHEMVGEPLLDEAATARSSPRPGTASARVAELAPRGDPLAPARAGSRHAGGRPDLATPQGRKLRDDLVAAAGSAQDPARRQAAVRSLARMFGPEAGDALHAVAEDPAQAPEVRDLAERLLGQTASTR
jgi:hypothetical protein